MSVSDDYRMGRLAQDYADAKRESRRIWEWLQSELRSGRSAADLADLEGLWAAMSGRARPFMRARRGHLPQAIGDGLDNAIGYA